MRKSASRPHLSHNVSVMLSVTKHLKINDKILQSLRSFRRYKILMDLCLVFANAQNDNNSVIQVGANPPDLTGDPAPTVGTGQAHQPVQVIIDKK